ncbi:MAG: LuxR family transcriptional regulator [Raoultibacter sp.]
MAANTKAVLNPSKERQRSFQQLKNSVVKHPYLGIGFGLYWMQTILLFQSPYLFLDPSPLAFWHLPKGTILVIASIATYLLWSLLFRKANVVSMAQWFPFVLTAGLLCGAILYVIYPAFLADSPFIATVLYIVGSVLIGCGMANVCLETGRIFGYLGPRQVLFHGTCALFIGTVGGLLLSLFPPEIGKIALIATPIPMVTCLWKSLQNLPRKTLYAQGLTAEVHLPKKFLTMSFFQGLALGVMHGLLINNFGSSSVVVSIGFMCAIFLLFFCAISLKNNFDMLIFRIGFPLMALGFFLVGTFSSVFFLGAVLLDAGYGFQYLITCSLCAYLAKGLGQPPIWIIGTGTACLLIGQFLGSVIDLFSPSQDILAVSMAVILLLAALFMIDNQNIRYGWGAVRPGSEHIDEADASALACQLLASEYELSKRETEVFNLIIKGYNRKSIGKGLCLSEETIKTHTGNIYQKFLVHSRQELIDLARQRETTLQQ